MIEYLNFIISILVAGLQAAARAALANVAAAEWVLAVALAGSAWLISSGGAWRTVGVLVFFAAVGAGGWLAWQLGRYGSMMQQVVLSMMVLAGIRAKGRA